MTFAEATKDKLNITGFSEEQKNSIFADLNTAYDGSSTAKAMIDGWLATAGNTIDISYVAGKYSSFNSTGKLTIDPAQLEGFSYITDRGKAVEHSQLGGLMHELGHALTGRLDNPDPNIGDFMGDNVRFVNTIWAELGITPQLSYLGQSWEIGSIGKLHSLLRTGYEYTNGAVIDGAITRDWVLVSTDYTRDLLIGGTLDNQLESGPGDDFLAGGAGDDILDGGDGTDTAVFFGNPVDYDIRRNDDGTWTSRHVRWSEFREGDDTLINIEKVQFGEQTYDLKAGGLTFQTDLALVIDTTGSMETSIASVRAQSSALIDALFADGKTDARIGVVSFKDYLEGDPTTVWLPFTDNDSFIVRRDGAKAALKFLGVGGGGNDIAETPYDGLLKALDGSMGEWRVGAGVHRIVLFTDAAPKDQILEPLVKSYAEKIGAVVTGGSMATGAGGSLATFQLAFAGTESGAAGLSLYGDADPLPPFTPRNDPVVPDTTLATVEIYTIFTAPNVVDTQALDALSRSTGGSLLTATAGGDVVTVLLDIIGGLDLVGTPAPDKLTGGAHIDKLTGLEGDDSLDGGANADTMIGDLGDDTYFVDHPRDHVVELPGEGTDGIATSLTFYVLPDDVENGAVLAGAGATLTANDLANTLTGGAGGDVVIGLAGDDLLQGADGDDLLFGGRPLPGQGSGQLVLDGGAGNDSIGAAIDLTNLLSLAADPDILDATTIPHVSIVGKGYGTLHYFAVGLDVGDVLTLDVDRGKGANTFVSVVAEDASVLASGNDSATSQGAGGSTSTLDAFLQYTAASAGVHYIVVGRVTTKTGDPNVGEQWASILQPGDSYELQVSVDAATPAGMFASGDDKLAGGLGADILFGGDGVDAFEGTLAELDGDMIGDYQAGERIVVQGVAFDDVTVSWSKGSRVVGIDVTGDGIAEASVTLDVAPDDLIASGLQLMVLPAGDGTDTSIAITPPPPGPVVSIAALSADRAEGDSASTPFTFAVTMSQAAVSAETVKWTVAGRGGTPASAADFTGGVLPSGVVTFTPGETSVVVTLDVLGDITAEADEGFSVFLSDASAGLALGAAVATGTILDDDGTVVAHGDGYVVREGQALVAPLTAGLLVNDEKATTASLVSAPSHGTVQMVGNGTFTYTPAQGFFGIDAFTYQAGNSGPTMAEAQAVIHVVPVQVGASTTLDLVALTAEEQIAATYAVFFGRAADAAGHAFWVGELNRGRGLPTDPNVLFSDIASSFGISDEAKGLYSFLVNPFGASDGEITAFLESVYDNVFDRASDAAGLAYWTGEVKATLQAGQFVGSVLVNIMSGAQDTAAGHDITTLMGKVAVSLAYVGEQQEHGTVWAGASDIAAATTLLEAVRSDAASVLVGVREAETLIAAHA